MEGRSVGAKAEQVSAKSNVQSLSASESALQDQVRELTRRLGEIEDKVARMRQECNRKGKGLLFERNGLEVRRNSTA